MTRPLFVFAHGAGAGSQSLWMQSWAARLEPLGTVHRFDYPYMQKPGRRPPDRMPRLLEAHRDAVTLARADHNGPVFLLGKSMGSRVGCHLSQELPVDGVICFGYPLQSGGKTPRLRDEILRSMTTRTLLIQGTRDPLCPMDIMTTLMTELGPYVQLHVVEGGDHSLVLRKKDERSLGYDQTESDDRIARAFSLFISQ